MVKALAIALSVILASFYFFPFEFVFLPGINTKMAMAGAGLVVCGINLSRQTSSTIDKGFFHMSIVGLLISLVSFLTMTYNNTQDGSFLTYIVSIWVWLGGAYCLVQWLKAVHGRISVVLLCNYLIAVSVAQCILAYTINVYAPLKEFVDSFLGGEDAFMGKAGDRLYGIGAALDVAGIRFSAVLVMISYLSVLLSKTSKSGYVKWYVVAFFIIAVIGNMMARTTTVGVVLALAYWAFATLYHKGDEEKARANRFLYLKWLGGILAVSLPVAVLLYNTNDVFYTNLRFGFEGFFSLWEKGRWEVTSNEILVEHMWKFPETWKTWLIGDGYCANPEGDPYYTGEIYNGFYQGTDIGYIRFLFYFGVIGTFFLIYFIIKVAQACMNRLPSEKVLFLLILLVNLVCWFKVSTDIFLAFAPFLCLSQQENDEYLKQIALPKE